jgi:hypothetical protein
MSIPDREAVLFLIQKKSHGPVVQRLAETLRSDVAHQEDERPVSQLGASQGQSLEQPERHDGSDRALLSWWRSFRLATSRIAGWRNARLKFKQ